MDRRRFLSLTVGGITAAAAVRTFPFRVFSFPSDIVIPAVHESTFDAINTATLEGLREGVWMDTFFVDSAWIKRMAADIGLS
jgi:hypothetical protein